MHVSAVAPPNSGRMRTAHSESVHHLPGVYGDGDSAAPTRAPILQFKLDAPRYALPLVRLPPRRAPDAAHRLRFLLRAGVDLLADQARLVTNYPVGVSPAAEAAAAFQRSSFHAVPFHYDYVNDAYVEIDVALPGAFEYHVEYGPPESSAHRTETGYFLVEPSLCLRIAPHLGATTGGSAEDERRLLAPASLDAVVLLTVVPKWLGPLRDWDKQFRVLSKLRYNMVHFVPLQPRGISGSPYSLFDQLDLDPNLFVGDAAPPTDADGRFAELRRFVDHLDQDLAILSMTDVVWNHTACNSAWLRSHPESGYNLVNSPHLRPAYELDDAIVNFSATLVTEHGLPSVIACEEDLAQALTAFRDGPFKALRLWEYYVLDVAAVSFH
ncbi:bifunctional 4-alpha-glucanotransferase/amylo-alpha-1,6-glucosidase [Blastocladiella emersonii ATCC 22665]|nr:bifunctional 4-alpha-glucanotransferase/amylo-alpha-1,6-glucosidase [Blastocladiella emersonii ATCC 22665]